MSEIYCGIGKVPKGAKRGNMKECALKHQVRFWGTHKVDSNVVTGAKKELTQEKTRAKLLVEFVGLNGHIRRVNKMIADKRFVDKKKELQKEVDGYIAKRKQISAELAKFQK